MSKAVYDARFFVEYFYSKDRALLRRASNSIRRTVARYVSTITLHELFRLSLEREGKDVARIRAEAIKGEFEIISVNFNIAVIGAELRQKYRIPMGDSLIAATSLLLKTRCVTDDPHFKEIKEIKAAWI